MIAPILIQDLVIDLTGAQRDAYDHVWSYRLESLNDAPRPVSGTSLFALLTKLRQMCDFDPVTGSSAKLEALRTFIDSLDQPTDKVIIFSQYVGTLEWLAPRLNGYDIDLYYGGLSAEERDEIVTEFEAAPGPRVC